MPNFDKLFPQPGAAKATVQTAPPQPPNPQMGQGQVPGGQQPAGDINEQAMEVIRYFIEFCKSQGLPPQEAVEMIMQAIMIATQENPNITPPTEEQVTGLVNKMWGTGGQTAQTPQMPQTPMQPPMM